MKKTLDSFRKVALWEGISAILLFFVAMPLKYGMDMPLAVTILGYIHGLLFILFLLMLVIVGSKYKWSTGVYVICFIACIVPFGTFVLDAKFLKPLSLK